MPWFELKNIARTLVLPPAGPLFVAGLGLAIALLRRKSRLGLVMCASGLATLWLLSLPVVSGQLMRLATPYEALNLGRVPAAQAIVILAGGVRRYAPEYNEDAPSDVTWQRLAWRASGAPYESAGAPDRGPRRSRRHAVVPRGRLRDDAAMGGGPGA